MKNFVHLHLHTQYSLLDGAIRLDDLFSLAKEYEMPAVAMTDHGNLFGAVDFYQKAQDAGIKPIIGCEMYVAPGDYRDKGTGASGPKDSSYHLVLLAENEEGYRNLNRLLTHAHLEGFYYKPRVDRELLSRYSNGLIALSACLKGEIATKLLMGDEKGARDVAGAYSEIYPGRFYLEIMENGIDDQRLVNRSLVRFSKELNLPLVATNDCHYLNREDSRAHDVLLCIQTATSINDPNRMKFSTDEFYVKSPDEMVRAFKEVPEAIDNTLEIANRCNFSFTFGKFHFPEYTLPEGEDIDDYFNEETRRGFEKRVHELKVKSPQDFKRLEKTYRERLDKEITTIKKMGFPGYFLIVSDFINYARQKDIPVGPGRGSAAGSLVAYSLGITDIDPIAYELLFERFLNPERISMPDIDIDFCKNGRDEVIHYVQEKYGGEGGGGNGGGEGRVAQIITFGKMQARAVIRDVGRALDMSYPDVDRIAKLIPTMPLNIKLDEAIKAESRLKELVEGDSKIKQLFEIARSLEGLNRHSSTHAAGIVISNGPLVDNMPLTRGQKGEVVTQFDMKSVEKLGLIKFDFLGLRTLTVIDQAVKLIKKNQNVKIDITNIPLDDLDTFKLLQSGNTDGIFQLESSGMRDLMVRLVPERFEEIIALVALYRPGPLNTGMAEEFIKRKHNKKAIKYELLELKEILDDTYGVMIYQEQVMQIAQALANFTPADGDLLRRAMGKKIRTEMAAQKEKFMSGALKNRVDKARAEKIFKQMEEFAEYGFNKSHSAAYAMVSYQTAYLKTHFPVEFMAATLTSEMDDTDKIMKYIAVCREMGVMVMPPNINESGPGFSVSGEKVIFGIAAVKNVGTQAIENVVEARREEGPFKSLFDFTKRVDLRKVNKRVIESLIKCGAFDICEVDRAKLMAAIDRAVELGQNYQEDKEKGQMSIFDGIDSDNESDHLINEDYPDVHEWSKSTIMAKEKESLGFYITGHPLSEFEGLLNKKTNCDTASITNKRDKSKVFIGGITAAVKEITTKKGGRMAFLTLEDMKGFLEVIVFADVYKEAQGLLNDDSPILVEGVLEREEESSKVIAKKIYHLKDAPVKVKKRVYVEIKDLDVSQKDIEQLKGIIERNSGNNRIVIRVLSPGGGSITLSLPEEMGVRPTDLFISEVSRLFKGGLVRVD